MPMSSLKFKWKVQLNSQFSLDRCLSLYQLKIMQNLTSNSSYSQQFDSTWTPKSNSYERLLRPCLPQQPLFQTSQWFFYQFLHIYRWDGQWWWTSQNQHGQWPQCWYGSSLSPWWHRTGRKDGNGWSFLLSTAVESETKNICTHRHKHVLSSWNTIQY